MPSVTSESASAPAPQADRSHEAPSKTKRAPAAAKKSKVAKRAKQSKKSAKPTAPGTNKKAEVIAPGAWQFSSAGKERSNSTS